MPPRPMSLLQKVAQDAKRRTLTASQGGLGLARELSQAHGNASAGALPPTKPPVHQDLLPARSSGGFCLVSADPHIIITTSESVVFVLYPHMLLYRTGCGLCVIASGMQ